MVVLSTFPPPTEGVRHCENNTAAHIQTKDLGKGTLYIAESRVSWVSEQGQGFSLEYPAISLHAVSRNTQDFPKECLYLMIDAPLSEAMDLAEGSRNDDDKQEGDEEEEEEGDAISEIRFVPDNSNSLDTLFKAMIDCQALHPDPDDSVSDEYPTDGEEDEAEYDVSAAEMFYGHVEDGTNGDSGAQGDGPDEPMDFEQFEDAEQ